jgi:hypothetical protein
LKRRSRLLAWLAAASGLFSIQTSLCAAEFALQPADAYGPVSVIIKGEIKAGDFERFQDFLLLPGHLAAYANYVWLDSRGGDLPEAMRFASLLEKSSASVVVGPDGKCYSACFMLFAAGSDRWLYAFGELGVHQIAVSSPQIDAVQRQAITLSVSNDLRAFLTRQGIPGTLIDRMMDTPPTSLYKIDTLLLKRYDWLRGLASRPEFLMGVETACGPQPQAEPSSPNRPDAWASCKINYQIKSTKRFVKSELTLIGAGQPSLLFAAGKLTQAIRAATELE